MCNKLCNTQKVVLAGKAIIVRKPKMNDVSKLLSFINSFVEEDAMINVNKKFTLAKERKWLRDALKEIKNNEAHQLIAEYNGKIIGSVEINRRKFRQSHVASYGISVRKDYRKIGLGTALSKRIIDIAKRDPKIKVLYLDVFANNKDAIRLYKRLGFRKVAQLSKRIFYKGKYIDQVTMDYPLKKI